MAKPRRSEQSPSGWPSQRQPGSPATAPVGGQQPTRYPPRDEDGRIATIRDMLGGVVFTVVLGVILLVAIDGVISVLGVGTFGGLSGWLAGILAVWMFVEEFRAWKGVPARIAVAFVGAVVALVVGGALGVAIPLAAVYAGAIAVAVATPLYALIWFYGIRYLASRFGER